MLQQRKNLESIYNYVAALTSFFFALPLLKKKEKERKGGNPTFIWL